MLLLPMRTFPSPAEIMVNVLPVEAARAFGVGLSSRTSIRARIPIWLAAVIAQWVGKFEVPSKLAIAQEIKMIAAGFPRTAMARFLASAANGLRCRTAITRPTTTVASSDAMVVAITYEPPFQPATSVA